MTITPQNRFQLTHATVELFGPGNFVIFDVTGEEDPQFVFGYDEALQVRDTLRAAHARRQFRVVA